MKEQDLLDLDFQKVEVSEIQAGGSPFYYYVYDFTPSFSLITPANDDIEDDKWEVEIFENGEISFKEIEDLKLFIEIVERNMIQQLDF